MLEPAIPDDEARRLATLRSLNILNTPAEERFDRLTRLAQQLLGVPIAIVSLVDGNRQWFKSCQGLPASEAPRSTSMCGHAILDDKTFVIPDTLLDARFADNPLVTGAPHIRFYAGQPLKAMNGSRVGTLCVVDSKPRNMTQAEIDSLRDLAVLVEEELNSGEIRALAKALQDSDNRITTILDNVLDGIITINKLGIVESFNKSAERIFGYAAAEVIGNNVKMLMPEPDQNRHDGYIHNYSSTGIKKIIGTGREVIGRRKDGSTFPMDLAVSEKWRGDNQLFIGIMRDITVRKHAEQMAETYRERLRRGQIFANIGTWDWDIQSGNLYWTERIATLFGYPEGNLETSYANFLAAVHPDDRQAVIDAVHACIEHDVPYEIEHRVVWQDGTVRWLLERGAVMRDPSGKPLQMLGVVQDVDVRKRAQLALADHERQLREAQALARIGNWSANLRNGELIWSDEIYRIFGHEPRSFTPTVEAFRAAVHPDDLDLVWESEKRAEQTGSHDVVHRIVRPDGAVRHVHELARAESDASGNLVRLVGTVQDVTERTQAEQALIAAREEADRANQAKSEFLSSMSHELRTPMNAILGFGQLIEYDSNLSDDNKENVHEILKAGHHLLELINEVLDLAKIESGHIDLSLEPVGVFDIVEECLSLASTLADKRGIELSHTGLKGITVRADRTRLKQALLNLLSNAIKYNGEGGSVRIEVSPSGNDRLRIRVTDTGPGIPAVRLSELFQPFNRLGAENSDIEGTGVGLTITRRIAGMMGGSVDVESEVGVGSTFWIELPIESLPEAELGYRQSAANNPTSTRHIDAPRHLMLYIEDNPSNLKLVTQILGRRKHIRLLTAHTPELGVQLALALQPALILLDINMPGMDGYQVLEVFKADNRLKAIPVVALTANAMPREIERGQKAGFSAYLTKPLDIAKFLSLLDHHLPNHMESET